LIVEKIDIVIFFLIALRLDLDFSFFFLYRAIEGYSGVNGAFPCLVQGFLHGFDEICHKMKIGLRCGTKNGEIYDSSAGLYWEFKGSTVDICSTKG